MMPHQKRCLTTFVALLFLASMAPAADTFSVSMATGFKVTEVTGTTATVWTRLTKHPERNTTGPDFGPKDDAVPQGRTIDEMVGSAAGTVGEVRVTYGLVDAKAQISTEWAPVDKSADFTRHVHLKGLTPGGTYLVKVEGRPLRSDTATETLTGQFRTAAGDATVPVSFTVVTGQDDDRRDDHANGHTIYKHMLAQKPDFFVHTGDVVYYDKNTPWAKNEVLARYKWQAMYALPFQRNFHRQVSSYFMRDDHDTTKNDSWPEQAYGDLTWQQGLQIFEEQTGLPTKAPYRTVRWSRDLQVWMPEGRIFRSPNKATDGPDKTIWGEKQKQWFFDSVAKSDATFRVLVSPTPVVGPDRKGKNDNHANAGFKTEGDEIRAFIAKQKNMFIVCGDRHWQYVSVDPKTGVREYSCGPTSNQHAGGWRNEYRTPMHKYLNVQGGFLKVNVDRANDQPRITFRHYNVKGEVANEETHVAK